MRLIGEDFLCIKAKLRKRKRVALCIKKNGNRLEKGMLKGLNSHINQVKYIGALSKELPKMVCCEQVATCVLHIRYDDADYNQSAVMNIAVYITSEDNVAVCEEKIGDVLERLGYSLTGSKPFSYSCDNGPIIMRATFQRIISMDQVTYALDEDDEQ